MKRDRYLLRGCYADNVVADPGAGGATFGTAELTFSGDSVQVPLSIPGLLTGSEGAYTYTLTVGGSGVVTGGTQRVTLATDVALPSGTNVIGHVIADSGSTTAVTQATGTNLHMVVDSGTVTTVSTVTSLSQFAGNAIDTNSGNKSAGTLRVVLATDQPQLTNKLLVTPDANSAVNVAQINGVTPLMGAGNTGTGSHRVTIATDQAAVAVKAQSTRSYKTASGVLTADTDVIAAVAAKRIKVFAYSIISTGTNANAAIFKSNGTAGTELWRFLIQGASGSPMGINLAVSPGVDGAFLFATVAGEKLTLDVGNADSVQYSLAYWDDDAT